MDVKLICQWREVARHPPFVVTGIGWTGATFSDLAAQTNGKPTLLSNFSTAVIKYNIKPQIVNFENLESIVCMCFRWATGGS